MQCRAAWAALWRNWQKSQEGSAIYIWAAAAIVIWPSWHAMRPKKKAEEKFAAREVFCMPKAKCGGARRRAPRKAWLQRLTSVCAMPARLPRKSHEIL